MRWSRVPPSSDSTTKHNTDFVEIAVDENALLGEAVYIVVPIPISGRLAPVGRGSLASV